MTAVILAAGRGSRLEPYTADRPKCLTELGGMTLIERQIATLKAAGVAHIVIVAGYRADMLRLPGTRRVVNARWQATNMVESLFAADREFGDDLIVAYGDIVYEPRVLDALLASPHDISVVVDRQWRAYWQQRFTDPLADAESLRIDEAGRITDIGNTVDDIDDIQAQYIGLMRFRRAGVAALKHARAGFGRIERPWMQRRPVECAFMTDLLMELILTGHDVRAVPVDGGWLEIDSVDDYEITVAMIADGSIRRFFDDALLTATAASRRSVS